MGRGKEREVAKITILVATGTPVDSIFRDFHKAIRGSWEQLGAGGGKVWREQEVGEVKG